MHEHEMKVRWLRRNRSVGALPFVTRGDGLPQCQKVLVFLPHSDDGRFIGATLSQLNAIAGGAPRNDVKIVVVCPGYRSVEGALSQVEKSQVRWEEALAWGAVLGFSRSQMINFNAAQSYKLRRCALEDRRRMDLLVEQERPTMVLVPHISDIAQHTNWCARRLALDAVVRMLSGVCRQERRARDVLLMEYPTLHVPILPPSDRNLVVLIEDTALALLKHRANDAHRSQSSKLFDVMGRLVEAVDALSGADDVLQGQRSGLPAARHLAAICLDPRESRGEHFGITRLALAPSDGMPMLFEKRWPFPLSAGDQRRWQGDVQSA